LRSAVIDVVHRQKELGVDVPGDGEYGKAMVHRVNYGRGGTIRLIVSAVSTQPGPGFMTCRRVGRSLAKWC
jgi:hypothetical protein